MNTKRKALSLIDTELREEAYRLGREAACAQARAAGARGRSAEAVQKQWMYNADIQRKWALRQKSRELVRREEVRRQDVEKGWHMPSSECETCNRPMGIK